MHVFFQYVAEAVAEQGIKGLVEDVPGGKYAYGVGERVVKKYRDRRRED